MTNHEEVLKFYRLTAEQWDTLRQTDKDWFSAYALDCLKRDARVRTHVQLLASLASLEVSTTI